MTSESLMLFGKYEGIPMKDLPYDYIAWLYEHLSQKRNMRWGERKVYGYLYDNKELLKLGEQK